MKITAVIVTYANRAWLTSQVVDECFSQGIDKVVIVDNGSPAENSEKLFLIQNEYTTDRVLIHTNKTNEGSAPGFARGIRIAAAQSTDDDWVLILDDDNKLDTGAVIHLRSLAKAHGNRNAYCCFRSDRMNYKNFLETHDSNILLGAPNTFMLFSIIGYAKGKLGIGNRVDTVKSINEKNEPVRCPCGPYGGLFISAEAIKMAKAPNEKLYLYFDDTEYTYNLKDKGIALWLTPGARVLDIDRSWGNSKLKKLFSDQSFEADEIRMKYFFRNRVYLEKKYFVNNKIKYLMNLLAYMGILGIKAILSGSIPRYKVICKSIIDGWNFEKNQNNISR